MKRSRAGAIGWLAGGLAVAVAASAQEIPGGLGTLALMWAQGDYRAPMICEIEGVPRRALRRVTVRTGPRTSNRALDRITFHDLEAPAGTHCYGETGSDQPNLIGSINVIFESVNRTDTAKHDFDTALRRHHGFTYPIATGRLKVGPPGTPASEMETVVFKEGSVEVKVVRRGSDAYRRLVEFGARTLRELVITAADGRSWSFEMVEWSSRGPG